MTKKELTIKACKELAERYLLEKNILRWFSTDTCPLCTIHLVRELLFDFSAICKGCPLASRDGSAGCVEFETYQKLFRLYPPANVLNTYEKTQLFKEACQARARFYIKIIPILENISEERFTKEGWIYFKELKRSW